MRHDERTVPRGSGEHAVRAQRLSEDRSFAARGGILQVLYLLAQSGHAVLHVLISRLFGPAVLGVYLGTLGLLEILTRLAIFGTDKGLYRFVAAHSETGDEVQELAAVGTALRLNLIVGGAIVGALMLFSRPIATLFGKPQVAPMLVTLGPAVLGGAVTVSLVAAALSRRRALVSLVVRGILEPLLLVVCAAVAYVLGAEAVGLGLSTSIASLLTALVALWFLASLYELPGLLRALRGPMHRALARFTLPMTMLEALNTGRQQAESLVLLAFLPLEVLGLYKASETIGRIATQIRSAFDGIAAPLLAAPLYVGDTQRLSETLRFLTRWVATLTVPVAITLVILRESLLGLFGPTFVQAGWVVLVHVAGNFLSGTFGLCGHVLTMSGHVSWLIGSQIAGIVLNLGTCAVFIPRWGLPGAVLAFALGITTVNILNMLGAWVVRGVHPFHRALGKPFAAGLAMAIAQFGCGAFIDGPFLRIGVVVLLGVVVYALAYRALGLEPEERAMVDKLRARLLGRLRAQRGSLFPADKPPDGS